MTNGKDKPSDAFKEFRFKCRNAKERLGSDFLAYVKASETRSYFIYGGNGASEFFQGPTFGARIVAASNREARELENTLQRFQQETASVYAPIDFYALMASQMTASYLEQVTYDEFTPQATAAAVMFLDMFGNLTVVEFNGDYEEFYLPESKRRVFLAACYDKAKRRQVLKGLARVKRLCNPDERSVAEVFLAVQKKLKFKYLEVAEIETDPGPEPVPKKEGDNA